MPVLSRSVHVVSLFLNGLVLCFFVWQDGDRVDCDFDRLDLSTNPYLEKNLEFLCNWIDDLSNEQQKFNQYTRNVARQKQVLYGAVTRRGGGACSDLQLWKNACGGKSSKCGSSRLHTHTYNLTTRCTRNCSWNCA